MSNLLYSSSMQLIMIGLIFIILLLGIFLLNKFSHVFVYIPNDAYGVVEKIWSRNGSVLSGLISLDERAGFRPDLLRGGPHFFWPFQYRVHREKLITVRTMAYVFARDGKPLPASQTLAHTPDNVSFEDVRNFLTGGGQRGPQRRILREGVYAINTAAFVVIADDQNYTLDIGDDKEILKTLRNTLQNRHGFDPIIIRGEEDVVGVVTVHDGPALDHGELIAPVVGADRDNPTGFHNSFQDPETFIQAGGRRGRQEQVLTEGTYFINRWFATVEFKPKTLIDVGNVGVVISYAGAAGEDVSGEEYKHGQLVARGHRGVWAEPLRPGKYPLNPFAYRVDPVRTTNFVLRWVEGRVEDHGFDRGLNEIPIITADGFELLLPLSAVVHIAPERAPKVIQQFGDINLLVTQTLDPIVSAFFKDAAQRVTLLGLISKRSELQADAKRDMGPRFQSYDLDLQEVMLGTPRPKPGDDRVVTVLDQLRQRQVAAEQVTTFQAQQEAANAQKELNDAKATADRQTELTTSKINVTVALNEGDAQVNRRRKEAEGIIAIADANAQQIRVIGEAEAAKEQAIGLARAAAIKAQVAAYSGEGADFQFRREIAEQIAGAVQHATVPVVPTVSIISGQNGEAGPASNLVQMLTAAFAVQQTMNDKPFTSPALAQADAHTHQEG
jgi:hypothetical protein